ncbi:Ger(x)C family spore germination C-terminal domain-containing protein [Paenibacillus mucilaginosus]|nr:Ger(x)C family spore germination C-terminal domain-containing protein [Paenibacillus mucilaginosus]
MTRSPDNIAGHPYFDPQTGKVGEADCPADLTKSPEIRNLQQQWKVVTKRNVEEAVKAVQRMNSDIFGFLEVVERDQPKAWKKMKDKWGDIFPTCWVEVQVEQEILRTGMRTKSSMSGK